ncbi:hypothetical protein [Streptomyces lavenduligriseus]|uniref:Uncharacterized protein n=1 Tax=Streptomyces lavenduligriseus TaxID=67315 RepID=A0ABT0P3F6_9ACTN|nr:hypothetical protein [Streptomyces lavenduligriseus]MCL3998140.1 hypothetical protein [Streptomyces lavenduligriseus]
MSTVDDLLAQSRLLDDYVPSDVIPYDDSAYYAFDDIGQAGKTPGPDLSDEDAAKELAALCETAVAHCSAAQLVDFLTDQVPQPRAAWILGCVLSIAGEDDAARFWWQYAAGADDAPASYCLYLHHLAHGDVHAAALWHTQISAYARGEGTAPFYGQNSPACDVVNADTSLPTLLRILSRLSPAGPRQHTETATAVIQFVSRAVTIGYDRHPDLEIPAPGRHFAEQLQVILAAIPPTPCAPAVHGPESRTVGTGRAEELPSRAAAEAAEERPLAHQTPEPRRLLVEVTAGDRESAPQFFKEASAVCWKDATDARPSGHGSTLAYYLHRFLGPRIRTASAH